MLCYNSCMEIIVAPNLVLSQNAKTVEKVDSFILKIIKEMKNALDEASDPIGVGLAAPQIGKSLRIFIAKPTPKSKHLVFINPRILSSKNTQKKAKKGETKLEGCLSLPDIWGVVHRPEGISVSFLDEKGKKHTKKLNGLLSVIFQHEIDHLNGILFTRRVLEQKEKLYKSHRNKKGEDIFEPIEI